MTSTNQSSILPPAVISAFNSFTSDQSAFALLLRLSSGDLEPLPSIPTPSSQNTSFQIALASLDPLITTKDPIYLIIRRPSINSLTLITYIPYLAPSDLKDAYFANRVHLLDQLGESNIDSSIVCKEPGEITDERAWRERDGEGEPWVSTSISDSNQTSDVPKLDDDGNSMKGGHEDAYEYKKTKCRMCDRRMKNPISASALTALRTLKDGQEGACVQLTVNPTTLDLEPLLSSPSPGNTVAPNEVAALISTPTPNFTFYIHPCTPSRSAGLYFIYYSPDSATVKERMTHTMGVPGLVNVVCKDNGIRVQRKLEVHCAEDIYFDELGGGEEAENERGGGGYVLGVKAKSMGKGYGDRDGLKAAEEENGGDSGLEEEKEGKYRSMFLFKNSVRGTESVWSGMEKV